MERFSLLFQTAIRASVEAGKATLEYYGKELKIVSKEDNSPLTQADLESNRIIQKALEPSNIPILSEESNQYIFNIRKNWKSYWLVDPLDGTKEFINQRNEYTINIALLKDNYPVFGVIYVPVTDVLYVGHKNIGAYRVENAGKIITKDREEDIEFQRLPIVLDKENIIIVASRSHLDENTKLFIRETENRYPLVKTDSYGSSLKLCMIAEGKADIYPRLGPTMEWDIAAGHAIVEAAGCKMFQFPSLDKLKYNKENLLNPWFIAYNSKYKPVK